jgi:hypothetical protein
MTDQGEELEARGVNLDSGSEPMVTNSLLRSNHYSQPYSTTKNRRKIEKFLKATKLNHKLIEHSKLIKLKNILLR